MKKYEEIKPIYNKIFHNLNGYAISLLEKTEREKKEEIFKNILYGEISLELLYAIYVLPPVKNYIFNAKIFYDLGSGIGNAIITSYLTGIFEKCVGIELFDSLYEISLEAKQKLVNFDKNAENKITFIHDNILNIDICEADIVLFCCPTKDENLRFKMEEKFKTLKKGSIIISLIHNFKDDKNFELLNAKLVKIAWGETPLLTYIKK
jgi:SAM-dependent methyltransferase